MAWGALVERVAHLVAGQVGAAMVAVTLRPALVQSAVRTAGRGGLGRMELRAGLAVHRVVLPLLAEQVRMVRAAAAAAAETAWWAQSEESEDSVLSGIRRTDQAAVAAAVAATSIRQRRGEKAAAAADTAAAVVVVDSVPPCRVRVAMERLA